MNHCHKYERFYALADDSGDKKRNGCIGRVCLNEVRDPKENKENTPTPSNEFLEINTQKYRTFCGFYAFFVDSL